VFNSKDSNDQKAPFWTGKAEVLFYRAILAGRFYNPLKHENKWDGGDVGFVMGQADPKMKGVMTKVGNHAISFKSDGMVSERIDREYLETVSMKYCSTVGLMFAGVLGPIDPMIMARQFNTQKRGADHVAADMASSVRPTKIRVAQEMNGHEFGAPKEFELFDLTCES
jgi:hypothetical protein